MADIPTSSIRYRGLIAPEEVPTADHRRFARGSLTTRRPPMPAMFNRTRSQRHEGAVTVARLEGVEYVPGRGWVGSGAFLNPVMVPEVAEAVYLIREGVSRPSVDLEPDLTYELVPNPIEPDGMPQRRVLRGRIMGFTFVPIAAFDEVEITVTDEADVAVLASAGVTFAVNTGFWSRMPVAQRETEFEFESAINRILEWSRGAQDQFRRAFLYQDENANPGDRNSYHFPIADIQNGRLTLIPRAVFSAATFLSGGHGGLPNVPERELERLRNVVTDIYQMLQQLYQDPRIQPPWERAGGGTAASVDPEAFGGDMPTVNYTVDTETGTVTAGSTSDVNLTINVNAGEDAPPATFQDDGGECGNLDTPDAGDLNTAARKCAASRGWAMDDGAYPIRSAEMHGASDLAKAIRAVGRGGAPHDTIRTHIMKRARSLGLSEEIPENWTSSGGKGGDTASIDETSHAMPAPPRPSLSDNPATFQEDDEDADCPEGQVRNDEGECVDREPEGDPEGQRPSRRTYETVTAAGVASPPREWFNNPNLNRATPLTVDDESRVFGHLATWNECHAGIGNRCVTAPHSATNYSHFKTGEVVCADGSRVPVGKITLGTGHADPALGLIPALEHYDNTGSVVAVVDVGEDRHGIWVAGGLVAGADEGRVAELRRSPLSGDWRRKGGNLELVAALAVNVPGFPVLRASGEDETVETLLAAGVVTEPGEPDPAQQRTARWRKVEDVVRTRRARELLGA